MYYAIVPSLKGYEIFASEETEALVDRMREGAFVYKNASHLSEFCDKEMLISILQFFNVQRTSDLHELICEIAYHSKEITVGNTAKSVKSLQPGKPVDGRKGTKRYMCLEVIARSKDSEHAVAEMVATLAMSQGRAKELVRYAIIQGYVIVGDGNAS